MKIPTLRANGEGHQFVIYGDSCSGVPDALNESMLRQVNAVLQRLDTPPEFVCFPGDEIIGLTRDEAELRRQWAHWFEHEMAWLDRTTIPLYHTTGNHTTYDRMSEAVFSDVTAHLPRNGPPDQQGLSYFVRRDNLLMIFVNTLWSGAGGEGNVETNWLDEVLHKHADAQHKLVFGHHPAFTVNGFFADYQRNIEGENGRRFWQILVKHDVLAYVCSHILAFDVQIHEGVLQICTAGAGTAHRMPEDIEYLHAIQAALDDDGLRYQVLDVDGTVREWLAWNWDLPPADTWPPFDGTTHLPPDYLQQVEAQHLIVWELSGQLVSDENHRPQTLFCTRDDESRLPSLWVGVTGPDNHLMVSLGPQANRSPHTWVGPSLAGNFSIQFGLHSGMGPGGLLWRWDDHSAWSTLIGASPWGGERLTWPQRWLLGDDDPRQPFRGRDLKVTWHDQAFLLTDYLD